MSKHSKNLEKLFSNISDCEKCVKDEIISIYPFNKQSKIPINKDNYLNEWDTQIPLKHFRNNNNISFVIGYDPKNNGKHLAVIDIDGYKKLPNENDNNGKVWYDEKLHKLVCDDLYQILKQLPIKSIQVKTWSNGYHIYYFTSQKIATNKKKEFTSVLEYIKFPNNYHIKELQGKGINEINDMVEILSTPNNKRVLTFPSKVNEFKKDSNGKSENRQGSYELLSKNPTIKELFDNPIDDIESLIIDVFTKNGFIFDEDNYKQAKDNKTIKKNKVKTYKNKNTFKNTEKDLSDSYKLTPKIKKTVISELGNIINKTVGKHNEVIIALDGGLANLGLNDNDRFELISQAIYDNDNNSEHIHQLEHSINNDIIDKTGFTTIITLEPKTKENIEKIKESIDKSKENYRKEILKPISNNIKDLGKSIRSILNQYDNDYKVVNNIEKEIEKLRKSVYPFDKYYEVYNKDKKVHKRELALEVEKEYNIKVFYDVDDKEDKAYYLTNDNYYDKLNVSILKKLIHQDHNRNFEDSVIKLILQSIPSNSEKKSNLIQFDNGVFDNNTLEFKTNDEFDIKSNFVYKKIGVLDESTGKTTLLTYYPNARLTDNENKRTYTESVLRKILIPKTDSKNYNLLIDRLERDGQTILGIPRKNITINYDPLGNSGKSVINHLHHLVLNEMYINVNAKSFDDSFNYELFSNNHSVNIDETTLEQLKEVVEQLKQFTSPISSRNSRKQYGTENVKAKNDGNIDIYTNHLIKIGIDDGGLLGRITIITFPNQFRKESEINKFDNAYLEDDKTYQNLSKDIDGLSWYVSTSINHYIDMVKVNGNFRCYQTKEQVLDIISGFDDYSRFCMLYLERDDEVATSNKEIKEVFLQYLEDNGKSVNDSDRKISQNLGNTIKELYGAIKFTGTGNKTMYRLRIKTNKEVEKDSKRLLITTEDDYDDTNYEYYKMNLDKLTESQKNIYNNIKRNELNSIEELQDNYSSLNVNKIVYQLIELNLIRYKDQYTIEDF